MPLDIANKTGLEMASVKLPVPSLTVCTSYARVYNTMGYFGMYAMLFIELAICVLIILLTLKHNKENIIPQCFGLSFFLLMSVFTNPLSYSVTGILVLVLIVRCFKYKFSRSKRIKVNE